MGVAKMLVSPEVLRRVLRLPEDAEIVAATMTGPTPTIELAITHPDLRSVVLGSPTPTMTPTFRVSPFLVADVEFVEWGQPDRAEA